MKTDEEAEETLGEAVLEMQKRCVAIVDEYLRAYPEDIFIPPPPGQHGQTVDACSAAALRAILPNIARDIRALR